MEINNFLEKYEMTVTPNYGNGNLCFFVNEDNKKEYYYNFQNISKYEKIVNNLLNETINYIENNNELFESYKFMMFDNSTNKSYLTAFAENLEECPKADENSLKEVAGKINMEYSLPIFHGKLNEEQINTLLEINENKIDFTEGVNKAFGTELKENELAGITVSTHQAKYVGMDIKNNKYEHEKLNESMSNVMENYIKNTNEENLDSIFCEMMSTPKYYNKLMFEAAKLNTISNIDTSQVSENIQKGIRKDGNVYKVIYENFIKNYLNKNY